MSELIQILSTIVGIYLMLSVLRHITTFSESLSKVKGSRVTTIDFSFYSVCIVIPIYYLSKITPDIKYTYILFGIFLDLFMLIFCALYHMRRFPTLLKHIEKKVNSKKDKK